MSPDTVTDITDDEESGNCFNIIIIIIFIISMERTYTNDGMIDSHWESNLA